MTIPNIYDAGFVKKMAIFSKKNSTTDILQGHKYASVDMLSLLSKVSLLPYFQEKRPGGSNVPEVN